MIHDMCKLILIGMVSGWLSAVMAHGDAVPQHGGIIQLVDDLEFELVAGTDTVNLYIEDHDEPLPAENISGSLTILNGTEKSKADLQSVGGNQLQATHVTLSSGARVIAVIKLPEGQSIAVRFTLP